MANRNTVAVLTGDIVKSTKMKPAELERVRDAILRAADAAGAGWQDLPPVASAEFFRGDAWQAHIPDGRFGVRAALFARAAAIAAGGDTRVAIGLGGVDDLNEKRVSMSRGEAFERSGKALDRMGGAGLAIDGGAENPATAVLGLIDHIASGWTARQAEMMLQVLPPSGRSMAAIAEAEGVSRQAVSKSLAAAGADAILQALEALETG